MGGSASALEWVHPSAHLVPLLPYGRRLGPARAPGLAVGPTAVVVVSADPEVRRDWSAQLESQGYRVLRCVGPQIQCALTSRPSCPLHAEAHWALYDERSLTPKWLTVLARASTTAIVVARDRVRSDGRHEPVLRRANGPFVPLRWELANKRDR